MRKRLERQDNSPTVIDRTLHQLDGTTQKPGAIQKLGLLKKAIWGYPNLPHPLFEGMSPRAKRALAIFLGNLTPDPQADEEKRLATGARGTEAIKQLTKKQKLLRKRLIQLQHVNPHAQPTKDYTTITRSFLNAKVKRETEDEVGEVTEGLHKDRYMAHIYDHVTYLAKQGVPFSLSNPTRPYRPFVEHPLTHWTREKRRADAETSADVLALQEIPLWQKYGDMYYPPTLDIDMARMKFKNGALLVGYQAVSLYHLLLHPQGLTIDELTPLVRFNEKVNNVVIRYRKITSTTVMALRETLLKSKIPLAIVQPEEDPQDKKRKQRPFLIKELVSQENFQ